MYHRRLALLSLAFLAPLLIVFARVGYLTTAGAAELAERAEKALLRQQWTPTVRGRILDRKGRVLAQDKPAFEIRVDYSMISGEWAHGQAERDARERHRDVWSTLDGGERESLISRYRSVYDNDLEQAWSLLAQITGTPRDEVELRRNRVLGEVQRVAASVSAAAKSRREKEIFERTGRVVDVPLAEVSRPIAEQRKAHALFTNVPDSVALEVRRNADYLPGVEVIDAGSREYPLETIDIDLSLASLPIPLRSDATRTIEARGVGTKILGWMRREVYAEDTAKRPRIDPETKEVDPGFYDSENDRIGHTGIEASQERTLRGLRGLRIRHLDTGQVEQSEPVPGKDVRLTIDAMLQARILAAMSPELGLTVAQPWHENEQVALGSHLNGAAVVIDISTGEILALVSTPSFTREDIQERPDSVFLDRINTPWIDRATEAIYPPGSIVKALMLVGAIKQGKHTLGHRIECTGHLLPGRTDLFRCWIYKQNPGYTHQALLGHALSGEEALAVSCNIYFYSLGRSLGPDGVSEVYRDFGMGDLWNLGVGAEHPGTIGHISSDARMTTSDAILMGIGQGPVAWTPLHAADAYATLARGGLRMTPRILADEPVEARDLRLDQNAVREAMQGLWRSTNDMALGTGARLTFDGVRDPVFNAPGVDVWGKTGTADAPPLVVDPDGPNGPLQPGVVRDGDHSWFVVLAGPKGAEPRYAIAVMMEYGGSGGKVSGPITNQIVHALVEEGYLPKVNAKRANASGGSR
jgi:penicillin-binding protein 2